jgi:hypothetical protein
MDPSIIPIASVVANVLSSLKNARDLAKDTSNAELRGQIGEAYDALLDLKALLLDMDEENRRLRAELAKRAEFEGPIPPFGYFYKNGNREHPMCPKCFQAKEQRESYLTPATPWNGGIRRECRICGHFIYEKDMDLRPRRIS